MTQVDEGPESPAGEPALMAVDSARVGEILAERYELVKHINQDAWGRQVWRGVDVLLRRPVGVILRYPGGDSAAEMLSAAVATSRVMHPHLIGVYDAADEGDRAYVVREWVEGQALRDVVRDTPLEPRQATGVAHAIADAVATLHGAGIAHGNIHPGTVLIGGDGRVVLADARADDAATPDADVRAVGAVLYAALTGRWPHVEAGDSSLPDAKRDTAGRPVAPHQVRGGMPMPLSTLASDLINPQLALPGSDELAAHLRRLDTEVTDPVFGNDSLSFEEMDNTSVSGPVRRRRGRMAVGIAGLLAIALVGLLIGTRWMSGQSANNAANNSDGSSGKPPTSGHQVTPIQIDPSHVRIVDPRGDGTELADAAKTVDGNDATGWKTDHYATAAFGNNKPGMGVLVDLGSARDVKSVRVDMAAPGATVELKAVPEDPGTGRSGDNQIVQNSTVIGNPAGGPGSGPTLTFPVGQQVRYLLVWITKLPSVDPNGQWPYQGGVQEIVVSGTS